MALTVEELCALPVAAEPSRRVLATVIDYRRLKVAALRTTRRSLFGRGQTVPFDKVAVTKDGLRLPAASVDPALLRDLTRYGELIGKAVFSERKRHLGRVETFKIDVATGDVTVLWVKTPVALRGLWRQTLVIGRDQIVGVTQAAVIVDELVVRAAMTAATTAQFTQQEADALGAGAA